MKNSKVNVLLFIDFFFRILSQMSFPLFSGAVYLATGKASQLAWVSVATFLPSIILTYQSNRIIHGFSPQKTMQTALIVGILLFISFAIGMKSIWAIYVLIALNSAFHQLGMAAKRTLDAKLLLSIYTALSFSWTPKMG